MGFNAIPGVLKVDRHNNDHHPWDPSEVKIDSRIVTVDSIYRRLQAGEIDLHPAFQRNQDLWKSREKSRFIESLLLGIPIPTFYFDTTDDSKWIVIDGLQRLTTLQQFFFEDFRLSDLQYLTRYEDTGFDDLPRSLSRRILETQFNINAVLPGAPERVVFDIFRRINTGGVTLTQQEIRNALNQGRATKLLNDLSDILISSDVLGESYKNDRQQVGELANRFIAFKILGYENYLASDMDAFLNQALVYINERATESDISFLIDSFTSAIELSAAIFGKNSFRKVSSTGKRSQVNKAIFEILVFNLSVLTREEIEILQNYKEDFKKDFYDLIYNYKLMNIAISHGTQEPNRVRDRFQIMELYVKEFIYAHKPKN